MPPPSANRIAEAITAVTTKSIQNGCDRRRLAETDHRLAGTTNALVEQLQQARDPAHAEAGDAAAMQQEERDDGKREEEQA